MKKTAQKIKRSEQAADFKLLPSHGMKSVTELPEAYDGGFRINRASEFNGRVVNKRSGLQSFTC